MLTIFYTDSFSVYRYAYIFFDIGSYSVFDLRTDVGGGPSISTLGLDTNAYPYFVFKKLNAIAHNHRAFIYKRFSKSRTTITSLDETSNRRP